VQDLALNLTWFRVGVDKKYFVHIGSPSPFSPEAVKKLLQVERVGRDIEKVLERHLFGLTTYNEKPQ